MADPAPPADEPKGTAESAAGKLADLAILIVEAGLLVTFLSALVFVAGWSYADRFFAEVGLSLSALNGVEATSFSAFAVWVFRDGWLAVLTFLIAAGFVLLLVITLRKSTPDRRLEAALALAALGALALIGAGYLGSFRAQRQVPLLFTEGYQGFSRVVIVAKKDTTLETFLTGRGDLGASSCLRKVFMDQSNLYAYAGYESLRGPRPDIFILPLEDIAAIEVVRNPGLCTP